MKPLDALTQACYRILSGDVHGDYWVFHHIMDADDKLAFDLFLVSTGDELAHQAGTTEYRFQERVRRMVADHREWKAIRV